VSPARLGLAARLSAVLLAVAILPACGGQSTDPGNTQLSIVVPTTAMSWILPYIANADGSFQRQGISATITVAGSGPLDLDAVASGSVDVGMNVLNLVEEADAQGRSLMAFGRVFRHWSGQLVASQSTIRKYHLNALPTTGDRLRAMKGLTIADVGPGTGDDALLRMLLRQAGLDPDKDVTITPIQDPSAALAALAAGRINAFLRASPNPEEAISNGIAGTVVNLTETLPQGLLAGTLVASQGWLAAHGSLARGLVAALNAAAADMAAHPAAVAREIRDRFHGLSDAVFNTVYAETRSLADDPMAPLTRQDFESNLVLLPSAANASHLEYQRVVDNSFL